jgi:cytochrome c
MVIRAGAHIGTTDFQGIAMIKELSILAMTIAASLAMPALAVDADAAQALAKKSNCMKCHSVSAKKDGPSFKETAAKYKGQADAEQKLITHLTTSPKIKIDGKEEEHPSVKTTDANETRNLAQWILAQ